MKKDYQTPEVLIVSLTEEDVITASSSSMFGPEDKDVTGNDIYNGFGG